MKKIVLASSSKYRKVLLHRILKEFETVSPDIDEKSFHSLGLSPRELAERLALEKALAVQKKHSDQTIIASDQLVHFENQVFGKPETKEHAIGQFELFSGKSHELITSVCVLNHAECLLETNITQLTMKKLTHERIQKYIDEDLPLDCAGSYKIEKLGISLFENIQTNDPTAIEGLPLTIVVKLLEQLDFQIP